MQGVQRGLGADAVSVDLAACTLSAWTGGARRCQWCDAALVGRQRNWCGRPCLAAFLAAHDWNKARHLAVKRDGGCVTCGTGRPLEVNHVEPRRGRGYRMGCWNHPENLQTLCIPHHREVTNAQAQARREGRCDRIGAADVVSAEAGDAA